ncbi:Hypothetical predicted protein [Lecanosticta acicola]|uniref:Uncharacterized protein n=1 Tax=Lecanosticta acicola TaxID=111012 RepID=A0AAI9E9P0_9PEZI|nr:Hypothetical predicted protein [Lecanosticta acicola]
MHSFNCEALLTHRARARLNSPRKGSVPTAAATDASALVAMKVFKTAELMEKILLHTCDISPPYTEGTLTILRVMQVNRAMRDTVNGSVNIQRAIGLLPDWKSNFRYTLTELPDSAVALYDHEGHYCVHRYSMAATWCDEECGYWRSGARVPHNLKYAVFWLETMPPNTQILRRMGSRTRSISLFQPPVEELRVGRFRVLPTNGQYITLDDIYRTDVQLRVQHNALHGHDLPTRLKFDGKIRLRKEDPLIAWHSTQEFADELEYEKWEWRDDDSEEEEQIEHDSKFV